MQSAIVTALMVIVSFFIFSEFSRNSSTDSNRYIAFKAENVANNILQYQDSLEKYIIDQYNVLHLQTSPIAGHVDKNTIKEIDYKNDHLNEYNKKDLVLFLNYKSVVFNFTKHISGNKYQEPVLLVATSFDDYIISGYLQVGFLEVMGSLGQDFSRHLYQGNSTYWSIPWLIRQEKCKILEGFSQMPEDFKGMSKLNKMKDLFGLICNEIQDNSAYKFLTYVYIQEIVKPSNN